MTDLPHLAYKVAQRLDYTTEDLQLFCEDHEEFAGLHNNREFCKHLDVLLFQCTTCTYWKPQRENATPDAGAWQCKECFNEVHPHD